LKEKRQKWSQNKKKFISAITFAVSFCANDAHESCFYIFYNIEKNAAGKFVPKTVLIQAGLCDDVKFKSMMFIYLNLILGMRGFLEIAAWKKRGKNASVIWAVRS